MLLITRGFGDALRIAYQNRPKLFVRHIVLPALLYEEVIEVDERIARARRDRDAARPRRGRSATCARAYARGFAASRSC